jgi:ribosomal protein S18 acetylase RimI-like enzyme
MLIRPALKNDLSLIQEMANTIWYAYYPPIIGHEQVAYMLDKFYSLQSLENQMESEKHLFYIVEINHNHIGFVSIKQEIDGSFFIPKFYISQEFAGKGIGKMVFDLLIQKHNPTSLRLTVNRQNFKAINFYFKLGFSIEKVENFAIGNGFVMEDFVMLWNGNS